MASLGSVVSTAITGGDAPVFERNVGVAVREAVKEATQENAVIKELSNKVDTLADALAQLVQLQTASAVGTGAKIGVDATEAVEAPVEPTPAEKAAATKAANKSKAEAAAAE